MFDRNDPRHNAAWQAARQWRARAHQPPRGILGGLKLVMAWLLFGALLIIGTLLGLFFLLLGWALLPIVRYRMKKRLEQVRAEQARDAGGGYHSHEAHSYEAHYRETRQSGEHELLEGEYEIRDNKRRG